MSLDVYLTVKGSINPHVGTGIFFRENGETKEISRSEWDEKFPNREPIIIENQSDDETVYDANITHNLGKMAHEAGIYKHLWRPDEIGITMAVHLIEPLTAGLSVLRNNRGRFEKFNPENGWGSYDGLVRFVENYLNACTNFPQSEVSVWR